MKAIIEIVIVIIMQRVIDMIFSSISCSTSSNRWGGILYVASIDTKKGGECNIGKSGDISLLHVYIY